MRRVETIIDLFTNDNINQEILDDLDFGIFPAQSMGFRCVPPETLIKCEFGWKRIDQIKPGDYVYTHKNRLQIVKKIMSKEAPSFLISFKTIGDYNDLLLTEGHEVFAIKRESVLDGHDISNNKKRNIIPEWIKPENLERLDYLTEAVFISKIYPNYDVNVDIAYLMGLYLGDGSISEENRYGNRINAVSIECDAKHDSIYRRIATACFNLGWSVSFSYTTKNTLRATIRHEKFGTLVKKLFGNNSHTKSIHQSVFNWGDDCKKSFIGGYIDADGHYDGKSLRISTVSEDLSFFIKHLIWSVDIPATIQKDIISDTIGEFKSTTGFGYIIRISKFNISNLIGYCQKVPVDFKCKHSGPRNFIFRYNDGKYIAKCINSVDRIDTPCDMVWNLEVAEDNSYVANNFIVHNCVPGDVCSICLNYETPFLSRAYYCDHLKNHMLEYDRKTGRLIYAINHNGYFFDLSIVRRPADRIAWGMVRVMVPGADIGDRIDNKIILEPSVKSASSDKTTNFIGYSSKIAEEEGIIDTVMEVEDKNTPLKNEKKAELEQIFQFIKNDPDPEFRIFGSKLVLRTDLPIEKEALNYFARNYSLNDIVSTFVGVGVIPEPKEFQRMVLVNAGQEKTADYLDENNIVFDSEDVVPNELFNCNRNGINVKLANQMREMGILDARSYYSPFLMKRATMIKEAVTMGEFFNKYPIFRSPTPVRKYPENYQQQIISQGVNSSAVGKYYQKYPNPVMNDGRYVSGRPEGATVLHKNNPLIPLAIIGSLYVGAKWLTGFSKAGPLGKAMSENSIVAAGAFGAAAALSWAIGRMGIKRQDKTSSIRSDVAKSLGSLGKDYMMHILAGVALSYGIAARAEKKREFGYQPNIVEEVFEKKPVVGSAIMAMAIASGLGLAKKLANEDLDRFENAISINDHIIAEYPPEYIDKMARESLNRIAITLISEKKI